jgi:hypothetical protein
MVAGVDSVRDLLSLALRASRNRREAEPWPAEAARAQASRRAVGELRAEDRQVRGHEQTHLAIAGPYARSAPLYTHMVGPDGHRYAVAGSVKVDIQPVPGDPGATLRKARAVMRAALGPGSPSAADLRIAAEAYRLAAWAKREIDSERPDAPGSRISLTA